MINTEQAEKDKQGYQIMESDHPLNEAFHQLGNIVSFEIGSGTSLALSSALLERLGVNQASDSWPFY